MTDEQNKPVRSRDEQIIGIATMLMALAASKPADGDPEAAMETAKNHILEAEARGAAEQRRKDAEGQEPVAWCLVTSGQQIINGIHVEKCHTEDWKHRRASDTLTPLYTHPANVAALEGRIAELEVALQEIIDTAGADCIHGLGPYIKIAQAALKREGTPS